MARARWRGPRKPNPSPSKPSGKKSRPSRPSRPGLRCPRAASGHLSQSVRFSLRRPRTRSSRTPCVPRACPRGRACYPAARALPDVPAAGRAPGGRPAGPALASAGQDAPARLTALGCRHVIVALTSFLLLALQSFLLLMIIVFSLTSSAEMKPDNFSGTRGRKGTSRLGAGAFPEPDATRRPRRTRSARRVPPRRAGPGRHSATAVAVLGETCCPFGFALFACLVMKSAFLPTVDFRFDSGLFR